MSILNDSKIESDTLLLDKIEKDGGMTKKEVNNSFIKELQNNKCDFYILDFYADARFPILNIDNNFLTKNTFHPNTIAFYNSLNANEIDMINNEEQYFELFKVKIEQLFSVINKKKVIINKAKALNGYYSADKFVSYNINTDAFNLRWKKFDDYVIKKYKLDSIDVMNKETLDFHNHPLWNPSYVHYNKSDYSDFLLKLVEKTHCKGIF